MPLDLSDDFEFFDNLTAVTLKFRDGSPNESVDQALQRAVTTKEALASNGKVTTSDVNWHLPIGLDKQPALGDKISHSGTDWTILAIAKQTLGTRLRCTCRDLVVANELSNRITIQIGTPTKGESNALQMVYANHLTNVLAKIQPLGGKADRQSGRHEIQKQWLIAFDATLDVAANYRIVDASGNQYKPLEIKHPEQIGELMTLVCEMYP